MTAEIITFPSAPRADLALSDCQVVYLQTADPKTGLLAKRNAAGHLIPIRVIRSLHWRGLIRRVARYYEYELFGRRLRGETDYSADWYVTEQGKTALRLARRKADRRPA